MKGKKQVSEYKAPDYETQHNFTVTQTNGKVHHVTANRMYNNTKEQSAVFSGLPGRPHFEVASFFHVDHVTQDDVPPERVWPSPIKGVEYYSLEDLRSALKELGYASSDHIIKSLNRTLSVRDDARYTIDELKEAVKQTQPHYMGDYYVKYLDEAALQARKNRVFEAHNSK